jgi:hypothetical protein
LPSLIPVKAPPLTWAAAHAFRESPRKVALINETARKRDFRKLKAGLLHELLGPLDTLIESHA